MKEQVDMTDGFVKAEECPFGCKDDYSPIVEESLGDHQPLRGF